MWCCGSCGSECVSNKSIVSRLTSNQQFHKKTRLTAQQPPLISHTTTRRWLRVHDSRSRLRGCAPTIAATTPAVVEKRRRSSAPALAAQRTREHQGLDKQLPARSEAGPRVRDYEGQGQVHHAPDIVERSTIKPKSALTSTIGSLRAAGCAWPREGLQPVAASRSVVDVDRRLVVGATECLCLGLQTRRARPKSFLRRPPRSRRRPSEPLC